MTVPELLRRTSAREAELIEALRRLDRIIESAAHSVVMVMVHQDAVQWSGGLADPDGLRAVLDDVLRDHTHPARTWVENRLEEERR